MLFQSLFLVDAPINNMLASPADVLFLLIKAMFLLGSVLYLVFALLVVRQTSLMGRTLITGPSTALKIMSYIHLAVAIVVVLFFWMWL